MLAALGLGVNIADCMAIEDSPERLASAVSAGVVTIGIPYGASLDDLGAAAIWETLDGRSLDALAQLVHFERGGAQ